MTRRGSLRQFTFGRGHGDVGRGLEAWRAQEEKIRVRRR